MPADLWTEAARMGSAFALVAALAVPVALVALAVRPREPLLPRWKPWRVPWNGFEVVVTFLVVAFVVPSLVHGLLVGSGFFPALYGDTFPPPNASVTDPDQLHDANTLRMLWAGALALPLQLAALGFALRARYPAWEPQVIGHGSLAGKVALAVGAWLVVTPVVLGLNAAVNAISQQQGVQPETHALARFAGRSALDQALFVLEACASAPLREEVLLRGLLLAWCVGRMHVPGAGVSLVTAARPGFVMLAAVALTARGANTGAQVFAGVLVVVFLALCKWKQTGARRSRGVFATAAFFALMHPVWPNPVALFVLGLALGWLAVRTNGVLVPVLVHALFNAVSAAFVLRSGAG